MGVFGLNLLLLKTENWKHCSKIIFKCVNSIVGPIFNIFLIREQCMHSVWTVYTLFITVKIVSQSQQMREKKKEQKTWTYKRGRGAQTPPISKNFYSLQNVQPFIFQLICMQLCIWLNCFFKAHNKQLNQYCLNFTNFFTKKKSFKKIIRIRVGYYRVNLF